MKNVVTLLGSVSSFPPSFGLDIEFNSDGIVMKQDAYVDAIENAKYSEFDNDRPLSRDEMRTFRGMTGKLVWLHEQTRPDVSYDSLEMSYHNKTAKVKDLKNAIKTVKKAKEKESVIHFKKIGNPDDLKILAYSDASYLTIEDKVKSVGGRMIFLSDKDEQKVSPLHWKGRTIPQVCKSAKDAENRALEACAEEAWYLAKLTKELISGDRNPKAQLPVSVKCDNLGVKDSVFSTKQVDSKKLRPVIQSLKDMILKKEVSSLEWVGTDDCHADLLTKKAAKGSNKILEILKTGRNQQSYF